ncbi:MAG TPA: hypothetical protein VFZ22_06300, partial [Pyrinomonadaceae bacterium]|nr:hypothetical protein [Pyrinomonadaceae bacterium]
ILELLLQLFGELFIDFLIHAGARVPWINRIGSNLLAGGILFVVGAIVGVLSLIYFPKAFVRSESLHGISLVITPVLAGLAMELIGRIRRRQRKLVIRLENFWYAYALAFGMALIRFYFTE